MTDNEQLIGAAKLLKENCEKNYKSDSKCSCLFADGKRCNLDLFCSVPKEWEIPTVRRFSDADIALAKALKAFGADKVGVDECGDVKVQFIRNNGNSIGYTRMPDDAFESVKKQKDVVPIDDIIREGENE